MQFLEEKLAALRTDFFKKYKAQNPTQPGFPLRNLLRGSDPPDKYKLWSLYVPFKDCSGGKTWAHGVTICSVGQGEDVGEKVLKKMDQANADDVLVCTFGEPEASVDYCAEFAVAVEYF